MAASSRNFLNRESCLGVHSIERRVAPTGHWTGESGRHCVDNPPLRKGHSGSTFRRFYRILLAVLTLPCRSKHLSTSIDRIFASLIRAAKTCRTRTRVLPPLRLSFRSTDQNSERLRETHLVEQALHAALRRFIGRSDGNLSKEVTSRSNSPCFDIAHQLITSHRKALGLLALEG